MKPRGSEAEEVGPEADRDWVQGLRRDLVAWYRQGHRDLPWRADHDPYRVLVAETMLVQTTVAAVVPYYHRFLGRFPTLEALASAAEADVVKAWEGLGYYRRARRLHQAAQAIRANHAGRVPDDLGALQALPGVGRYIAGAVMSFAFDKAAPIVEANTRRVLARLIAWPEDLGSSKSQARLWTLAEALVPEEGAGTFNQAIMELGATVCSPKGPMCLICPVSAHCRVRKRGLQDEVPVLADRPKPTVVEEECAVVEKEGRWLMVQRGPNGLWAGFWEFPTLHRNGPNPADRPLGADVSLQEGVRLLTGVRCRVLDEITTASYSVTKYRVTLTVCRAVGLDETTMSCLGSVAAWFGPDELAGLTLGSATRKLIARLGAPKGGEEASWRP